MTNPLETTFPVGCLVRAYRDGEMWAGIVKEHHPEAGYLTVQFSNSHCERYAYIEVDDTPDSMVVYQFSGGLHEKIEQARRLGVIIEQSPKGQDHGTYTVKWSNCAEYNVELDEMDDVLDEAIKSRKQMKKSLGYC